MSDVITHADQVEPEWLSQILRASGVLERGRVVAIRQYSHASQTASVAQLQVSYSDDAPATVPARLFLKLGRRKIEADFFNLIAPAMVDPPIVRCYDAVFSPESGKSHLLFDDLSATHGVPDGAIPPPLGRTEAMVDALAHIHAHWWQHPRLSRDIKAIGEDVPSYVVGVAQDRFPDFVDFLGDRLSAERCRIYEKLFAAWPLPSLTERLASGQALTLVHGDTHFWNFLIPHAPAVDKVRIIDWAVWHIGIGVADLAYMIALFWFPERRARMEQGLVRRYHAALEDGGVAEYSLEQCWLDYRRSLIFHVFWPIFWSRGLPQHIWWHALERGMLAFEDLGCEELLE